MKSLYKKLINILSILILKSILRLFTKGEVNFYYGIIWEIVKGEFNK